MTDSPLLAASADSITELFETDPTNISDAQFMALILELRRRRNEFLSQEAAKSLAPKKTRTRAEPQSASAAAALDKPLTEVNLDDL